MAGRVSLLLFGVLLLGTIGSIHASKSRNLLQLSVKLCTQLHPQCRSCAFQGTENSNNSTAMICLSCTSPGYRVTEEGASCGEC
jgi:hypothetical protein